MALKNQAKLTGFFRYVKIVIKKQWKYLNLMFYIKFIYLRILKIFIFLLEGHSIMTNCSSEM